MVLTFQSSARSRLVGMARATGSASTFGRANQRCKSCLLENHGLASVEYIVRVLPLIVVWRSKILLMA
jgi:hypothetical protein